MAQSNIMKRIFLSSLFLLMCTWFVSAQDQQWVEPGKESQEYSNFRSKVSVPPYGLAKVKALIAKIAPADSEEKDQTISQKDYNALSLREKFTYHMIYGESYAQNCDAMPPLPDAQKKIFAQFPSPFGENYWSVRQRNFLHDNKDSVIALIKESANRSNRIGCNYKEAIVEMNAVEMIPFLEAFYLRDKKDRDILTIFMQLMKNNKYEPFLNSVSNKKLYGEDADFNAWINYNSANEALILERVNDFYKNFKK
jgi:hypothetical protein